MSDFYCDEVLSGSTKVKKVFETDRVLAYHHTRPYWPIHIVVIPKTHVGSLLTIEDNELLLDLLAAVKAVAGTVVEEHGAARVLTNLGEYQDSQHLHFHVNSGDPVRVRDSSRNDSEAHTSNTKTNFSPQTLFPSDTAN